MNRIALLILNLPASLLIGFAFFMATNKDKWALLNPIESWQPIAAVFMLLTYITLTVRVK